MTPDTREWAQRFAQEVVDETKRHGYEGQRLTLIETAAVDEILRRVGPVPTVPVPTVPPSMIECPACVTGCIFVGWGRGWETCTRCGGTTKVSP